MHGDLSSLCWIENNFSIEFRPEDMVRVVYSSLNFRDIMFATGKLVLSNQTISRGRLFQHVPLGLEYAGYDSNGQRVMGMCPTE
jgi:fatty acid synthase